MIRADSSSRDGGFTLVETIVALTIIGIVMTAAIPFLVTTQRITRQQDRSDSAAQLATAAMSRVRSIKGSSLVSGRDAATSDEQWSNAPSGVAPYLANITVASDPTASIGSGPHASLPTVPTPITVGGDSYEQHYYVAHCWRPTSGGLCGVDRQSAVPLLKVIIAVTWTDNACPDDTCSYVTATLADPNPRDPVFVTPAG